MVLGWLLWASKFYAWFVLFPQFYLRLSTLSSVISIHPTAGEPPQSSPLTLRRGSNLPPFYCLQPVCRNWVESRCVPFSLTKWKSFAIVVYLIIREPPNRLSVDSTFKPRLDVSTQGLLVFLASRPFYTALA